MKKKLSQDFQNHLDDLREKINSTSDSLIRQAQYIGEEQRIIDEKKEILDERFIKTELETKKQSWIMTQGIINTFGYFIDRIMNCISKFFEYVIDFLRAIRPILVGLVAIICVFVLFLLLGWFFRGGKFKLGSDSKDKEEEEEKGKTKTECSTEYKQSGISSEWNWNIFITNPIKYTMTQNFSKISKELNIPDTLNKLKVINPLNTLKTTFKVFNNDNFKFNRETNETQRDDNISYVNYGDIDKNISNKYFLSEDKKRDTYSISLLKPKNIEWELPHLDYINTDMSKLPESIKNYKNQNELNDYSLNDTSTIIFPWTLANEEWIIDCNTKFKNNKDTNLYESDITDNTICKSKTTVLHLST